MVSVCQICKEPIWNFFCPDCLAQDIKKWLPSTMATSFLNFHSHFSGYFQNNPNSSFNWCLKCKTLKEASVCPYCYANEVIYWLKESSPNLANKFSQLFPYDFERLGHKELMRSNIGPVTEEKKERTQSGICDMCGEYSDNLKDKNGEWVCEECTA